MLTKIRIFSDLNAISVLFTYFLRDLTNSFVARDVDGSRWGLVQIFVLLGVFVPAIYAYSFTKSAFANFWREAMTLRFFGGYLGCRFFYRLSSTGSVDGVPIDNPDQRIAQAHAWTREEGLLPSGSR